MLRYYFLRFADPLKRLLYLQTMELDFHGVLSNNNKYDIRDDKVLRITVDGKLKTRADMIFSEFHSGISVIDPFSSSFDAH
jgi:hypothetical protein